jgi:hypothetical protein
MKETIKLLKSRTTDIMNYFFEKGLIDPDFDSYEDPYYIFYVEDQAEIKVYIADYEVDIYFMDGTDSQLFFNYGELEIKESIKKIEDFILKIPYFKNLHREKVLNELLND